MVGHLRDILFSFCYVISRILSIHSDSIRRSMHHFPISFSVVLLLENKVCLLVCCLIAGFGFSLL